MKKNCQIYKIVLELQYAILFSNEQMNNM